jgi:hypothetical protein
LKAIISYLRQIAAKTFTQITLENSGLSTTIANVDRFLLLLSKLKTMRINGLSESGIQIKEMYPLEVQLTLMLIQHGALPFSATLACV